jgi:uncharacterized protein (DUF4415 family)
MKDEDIDFSDIPSVPPEMFARGIVRRGLKPVTRKKQLTLRVDIDVVEWYQMQGPGYQTRINLCCVPIWKSIGERRLNR